jgi:6-pyruvoyltetrahydropterin/6-carboxytetrahydropterin synthase
MKICKSFTFDSAHRLFKEDLDEEQNKRLFGKCFDLHGHTYKLEVEVSGNSTMYGMVLNFNDVKAVVRINIIDQLDHKFLNDVLDLPTAENLLEEFIVPRLLDGFRKYQGIFLSRVRLWETPTSWAEWSR